VTCALKKKSGFDNLESLRPYEDLLKLTRRILMGLVYLLLAYYWADRGYPLHEVFIANMGVFMGELLLRASDMGDIMRAFGVVLANVARYYLIFQTWTWIGLGERGRPNA